MSSETDSSLKPRPPPPKGILKKSAAQPSASPSPAASAPPSPQQQPLTRAEQLARQEAAARLRLLQKLRDTELKPAVPISTFETLSWFPRAPCPPHDAAHPSAADASYLLAALRDFQPSEYLDLVEERNCLGRCGYALCPRPRRELAGAFKLSAARGGAIARTADLNKWCSDACAARALYLKVQLDNPSYERRAGDGKLVVKLELREEEKLGRGGRPAPKRDDGAGGGGDGRHNTAPHAAAAAESDQEELARAMAQLELDQIQKAKRDATTLAVERGDAGGGPLAGQAKVEVTIREKSAVEAPQPPTAEGQDAHLITEGYRTTFGTGKRPGEGDESEDDDDFPTLRF